ncbi:MAG: adenosylcobinamide-phosphate synthase CbiB [Lachnospiraceae bacterium]|nr:adenosylcobinamide-phosphate synthase CbiB [Lachnospiraceae bacterium]
MLFHTISLILGIIIDQMIGDPHFLPHPVRAIGRLVSLLEKNFPGIKRDAYRERKQGILLWFTVIITVTASVLLIMILSYRIDRYAGILVESILTAYILAARSLCRESMAVGRKLEENDISGARAALSMIVGRDTEVLDKEQIIKATVETVAENTSDGVTAPLIYTAVGGPVLGMLYKAVNTMDSMIGYKNKRYENFGYFAAKADDVFNYIPARLSALSMIAGCFICGLFSEDYDAKAAYRIWKRDRNNHSSPNSAQTESVCAGALGLLLGGTHLYQGVSVEKPEIGDETGRPRIDDIKRANRLMFMTEAVSSAVLIPILFFLFFLIPVSADGKRGNGKGRRELILT